LACDDNTSITCARGDARHQFHRERRHAGFRDRLQRRLIAVGVHDGDHQRTALVLAKLGGLRPLHLDDDVGILQRVGADGGAGRGVFGIGQARLDACARLDRDIDAQRLEFLHDIGRSGHPRSDGSISLATAIFMRHSHLQIDQA